MSENRVKSLPLEGKRILVTRSREQAGALSERLRMAGAIPVEFPTIRIVAPQDWDPLDEALGKLCAGPRPENYDWLVFTSANGVHIFFERMQHLGYQTQFKRQVRVAAIGPATGAALAQYGIDADLVPDEYIAEGVAAALVEDARRRGESLEGKRILLARAAEARKVLVTELQEAGARVDEVAAYRTLSAAANDRKGGEVLHLLRSQKLDILTFTSSSTVRNFMHWLGECEVQDATFSRDEVTRNARLQIACIGPITSQTARELGLNVSIEAKVFTIDGLVEAIVQHEEQVS